MNHYLIDTGWGKDKDTEIKKRILQGGKDNIYYTYNEVPEYGVLIDSAQ